MNAQIFMADYSKDSFTPSFSEVQLHSKKIQEDSIVLSLIEEGYLSAEDIALVSVIRTKDGFKIINRSNMILFNVFLK